MNRTKLFLGLFAGLSVMIIGFMKVSPMEARNFVMNSSDIQQRLPVETTLDDILEIGLTRNRDLLTEKLGVISNQIGISGEAARFDPRMRLDIDAAASREEQSFEDQQAGDVFTTRRRSEGFSASLEQQLRDGTIIDLGVRTQRTETTRVEERFRSRMGIDLRRPLLRDAGTQVTGLSVTTQEKELEISQHELRGFVSSLVQQLETNYWNYYLAREGLKVHQQALKLTETQLEDVKTRIELGTLPSIELASAKADLARQREQLINARNRVKISRLELLHLMHLRPGEAIDKIVPAESPSEAELTLPELEELIVTALENRSELAEAELRKERQELQLVRTNNGLLPRLDFFLNLGQTGFAGSFSESIEELDSNNYSLSAGLNFEYRFGNRAASSEQRISQLRKQQQKLAVENLARLIELDVHKAYLEVQRSAEQLKATRATRDQSRQALEAEQEKLRRGRTTSQQIAVARQNLTESEISVVEAQVDLQLAQTDLQRQTGLLLSSRGIKIN